MPIAAASSSTQPVAQRAASENASLHKKGSRSSASHRRLADRAKHRHLQDRARTRQNARSTNTQHDRAFSADWEMGEGPAPEGIPVFNGVTLPRQLARPSYREPAHDALAAIDPALLDTNIEFIKDCLELNGSQLFNVLKHTSILSTHQPRGPHSIPTAVRVRVKDTRADLPTHYLAVYSSLPSGIDVADTPAASSSLSPDVTRLSAGIHALFSPVHSIVLAVHLPRVRTMQRSDPAAQLPPDFPYGVPGATAELTLPMFALPVPSPKTFHLLLSALYTQRYDNLLRALLGIPIPSPITASGTHIDTHPLSQSSLFSQSIFSREPTSPASCMPPATPSSPATLDARLTARITNSSVRLAAAYHGDSHALLRRARLTGALAANARVLGTCDAGLWGALDVAWAIILGALSVCTGGSLSAGAEAEFASDEEEAEAELMDADTDVGAASGHA